MMITPRWIADREYAHRRHLRRLASRARVAQEMTDRKSRATSLFELAVLRTAHIRVRSHQRDLERQIVDNTQRLALRRQRRLSGQEVERLTKRTARLWKQLDRTCIENLAADSWTMLCNEVACRRS